MGAINSNALSKFIGILEIAPIATGIYQRLASVRGMIANIDNTVNQVQIDADDTGTIFKGSLPEFRVEGSFLENADRDIINALTGGDPTDVAGTLVSGATQVLSANAWAYNRFYEIVGKNGNGNAPTITSVIGATDGALVAETDYFIVKNDRGVWGIMIKDSVTVTTLNQNVTITYSYTPNAEERLTLTAAFREDSRFAVRITATDIVTSKTRIIELSDATYEGVYGLEFLDVITAGDLTGTEFTFKAAKGSTLVYKNQII